MNASSPLHVGLVGYGMAGRDIHRPLLHRAGLDVGTVSTANPERIGEVAEDLPHAVVVPDLEALLERRPDVVIVASPTGAHTDNVTACIEAGVPVVVDKPLSVDAPQARALVEAAEAAGVGLTVFQNRRFDDNQRTLAWLLEEGRLGDVFRVERRYERFRPVPKERWREQVSAAQGGGLLLDLASHLVDAVTQLFGPVRSVYAEVATRTTVAEDDAFLLCHHDAGVSSHLAVSSLAAVPGPTLRVLGTEAGYVVGKLPEEPSTPLTPEDADGCTGWLVQGERRFPVRTAPGEQADFYRQVHAWLREGGPVPVDPWDAVHTAEVLDAARVSAAERRVVDLGSPS